MKRLEILAFELVLLGSLWAGATPVALAQRMVSLDNEVFPEAITPASFAFRNFRGTRGGRAAIWLAPGSKATYLCLLSRDVPWPQSVVGDSTVTLEFHVNKKPRDTPALILHEDRDPPVRMDIFQREGIWFASAPVDMNWFDLGPLFEFWDAHPEVEAPLQGMTFSQNGDVVLRSTYKWFPYVLAVQTRGGITTTGVPKGIEHAHPDVKFE